MRPVALAGFMGAGKTTVGRLVGERLGRPFHDTDDYVEAVSGRRVEDYFAAGEEALFRRAEAAAVAALVAQGAVVVALGGGALLDPASRRLLLERALLIHLDIPWPVLMERLPELEATRPLLRGRTASEVEELFTRRRESYEAAPFRVVAAGQSPAELADQVVRIVQSVGED